MLKQISKWALSVVILLNSIVTTTCTWAETQTEDKKVESNQTFLEENKKNPGVITLPSGLQYKIIKEGELITVDFGCKYQGYCSDFTRTFAVGKEISPKLKEIYQIVKEAQ